MHLYGFSSVQKGTKKASEGLGTTLRDELKNLVRFRRTPPLNIQAGGGGGGVWKRGAAAPGSACRGRFLKILMRFIDPSIFDSNDIHRPYPGPQENMQIGGVRCAISQIWSKFKGMAKIWLTSTFDLRLLGLWGVMNIINGIARGVSPCVRAPPSLATEERMLRERSTYESGVR